MHEWPFRKRALLQTAAAAAAADTLHHFASRGEGKWLANPVGRIELTSVMIRVS